MSRYIIRRATLADCSDIAAIYLSAFQDEEIVHHLHRNLSPEIQHEYQKKRFQKGIVKAAYDGTQYFKAVDEKTGHVHAFPSASNPSQLSSANGFWGASAKW